jgi:3-(3-hydroxy-phenyl)propionate hydroxylase
VEKQPERIIPRIEKVVGHKDFRLDWTSIYTFQCRRLRSFVHDRVLFVGDSAHIVSPFGARGGNGGLQDVDALGWRLAAVVKGAAPVASLAAYDRERCHGADENLLNSSRSTRFMSPAAGVERLFRDAVLHLAARADFARPMVNSGRLSRPCTYPLHAPDDDRLPAGARPGSVAPDAPQGDGWLIDALGGRFVLVAFGEAPEVPGLPVLRPQPNAQVIRRWLGSEVTALYLVRPDQVVAARWVAATAEEVAQALAAAQEGRT